MNCDFAAPISSFVSGIVKRLHRRSSAWNQSGALRGGGEGVSVMLQLGGEGGGWGGEWAYMLLSLKAKRW